jgi:hypothetical protein
MLGGTVRYHSEWGIRRAITRQLQTVPVLGTFTPLGNTPAQLVFYRLSYVMSFSLSVLAQFCVVLQKKYINTGQGLFMRCC